MSLSCNVPDIVIPIYNAYDDVILCIESIKKHTDLSNVNLILINDKSTDERILPFLKLQQDNNIILIDNEKNLGFSASVNKGMQNSNRDVILLNSDTIVTKNWIEKLVACAYSEPEIGTVTPLSNSATLCSVPIFCQDNDIPKNVTIDEFAELIERCSLKRYPQITVAVGFCMYIKREVINIVGLFDADTFKKGYGEENDFCNRAEQYGYKHVMCDDTLIYHKGTVSFQSDEKKRLIENHTEILNIRYKLQMVKNHEYCMKNPDQFIRENINIYLKLKNNKENILYFLHSDFHKDAEDNTGGTQLHVQDLALGLVDKYNVFVLSRDRNYFRLTVYMQNETLSFKFYIGRMPDYPVFTNSIQAEIIRNILAAFSINLVHVHHTFGLSFDIFNIANDMAIPLYLTLHDYYYICPTIKLFNNKNQVCIDRESKEMCQECIKAYCQIAETVDYLPKWRKESEKVLQLCDRIITPSESAKRIYLKYYPSLAEKIEVIEHGSDKLDTNEDKKIDNIIITDKCKSYIEQIFNGSKKNNISGWAYLEGIASCNSNIYIEIKDEIGKCEIINTTKLHRRDVAGTEEDYVYSGFDGVICKELFNEGKLQIRIIIENDGYFTNGQTYEYKLQHNSRNNNLNVAFIGGLNIAKGSEFAYNLIKNERSSINWYIFGSISDERLNNLEQNNLIKTGSYNRESISRLFEKFKIDIVCILPVWHETFCYTLSEALLNGIPVITTDIGAVGERVKKLNCGWSIPVNSSYDVVLNILKNIKNNAIDYKYFANNIKHIELRSIFEMVNDYSNLYSKKIIKNAFTPIYNTKLIYDGYILANKQYKHYTKEEIENGDRIAQIETQMRLLQSSTTFKMLVLFGKLNIPFKSLLKKIITKVTRD